MTSKKVKFIIWIVERCFGVPHSEAASSLTDLFLFRKEVLYDKDQERRKPMKISDRLQRARNLYQKMQAY